MIFGNHIPTPWKAEDKYYSRGLRLRSIIKIVEGIQKISLSAYGKMKTTVWVRTRLL